MILPLILLTLGWLAGIALFVLATHRHEQRHHGRADTLHPRAPEVSGKFGSSFHREHT